MINNNNKPQNKYNKNDIVTFYVSDRYKKIKKKEKALFRKFFLYLKLKNIYMKL